MTKYSYATVSTALARVFNVGEDQRTALRGRLQHLRTLGIPEESPGRGGTIAYSDAVVDEMLLVLELLEFGLDPTLAAALVKGEVGPGQRRVVRKRELNEAIRRARRSRGGKDDLIFVLIPALMSVRWRNDPTACPAILRTEKLGVLRATEQLTDFVGPLEQRRALIFNMSERLRELDTELAKATGAAEMP